MTCSSSTFQLNDELNLHAGSRFDRWCQRHRPFLNPRIRWKPELEYCWQDISPAFASLDDARGCLQDIHWSGGAIGYFPTYTLGNLYAAQFFEQAATDIPGLDESFSRGDFAPLLGWLREKIHRHGKRFRAGELVRRVTGQDLSAEPLLRHLKRKGELYGVS